MLFAHEQYQHVYSPLTLEKSVLVKKQQQQEHNFIEQMLLYLKYFKLIFIFISKFLIHSKFL